MDVFYEIIYQLRRIKTMDKSITKNAYVVYNKELNDIGDMLFSKKKEAIAYIRSIAYKSSPEVMAKYLKQIKKKYKIIKVQIGMDFGEDY